MPAGQASLLDQIPGASQGVAYLMGQVAQFQRVPMRLTAAETNAVAVKRAAESRGNLGAATNLALAIQSIMGLQDQFNQTSAKLADVLEGLRTAGFAMTPIDLATTAVTTAGEVAAILAGTAQAERAVYQAAGQVLTADELARLKAAVPTAGAGPSVLTIAGGYAKLAGLGLLGVLAFVAFRKRRRA
jgi:hypothetical protein